MSTFRKTLTYLEKQKWHYTIPEEECNIATMGISTEKGKFHCIIDVDEIGKRIIFFSIYPINVPVAIRKSMAEIMMRVNYTLFFGNYEMDFSDGEIRFKTSLIYEDIELTDKILEHIIKGNIVTLDTYFELFNSFISGKTTLEDIISQIES
ncbi:YbjN domain-containing protein [Bernardetia sp. MNP-M8]|uniref:YbjN domain-containing protein n=1 Tax=Bernardetia sp. MNP-M8 TaxID=3127470 RepID=UPI0030CE168F